MRFYSPAVLGRTVVLTTLIASCCCADRNPPKLSFPSTIFRDIFPGSRKQEHLEHTQWKPQQYTEDFYEAPTQSVAAGTAWPSSRRFRDLQHRGGSAEPPAPKKNEPWFGFFGSFKNSTASESQSEPTPEPASPRPAAEPTKETPKGRPRRKKQGNETATTTTTSKQEKKKRDDFKQTENAPPPSEASGGNQTSNNATGTKSPTTIEMPPIAVVPTPSYHIVRTAQPTTIIRPGPTSGEKNAVVVEVISRLLSRAAFLVWTWRYFHGHDKIVPIQHFVWERLNDQYTKDKSVLHAVMNQPPYGIGMARWRFFHNWRVLQQENQRKAIPLSRMFNRTVVVIPLGAGKNGELDLPFLTEVISFLVDEFRARTFGVGRHDGQPLPLEVVLLVSSPGGSVSHYGLAAAQVQRLKQEDGITLTVCVDRTAASGGYMVASQADKLIAAPFASVGSVGVLLEGLNLHDVTQLYGIRPISLKSGKHKNTLSTFGPITKADERYETERLTRVHEAFQDLVISSRSDLANRKEVLEGQVYFGLEAVKLNLIDEVMTSDEYIMHRISAGDRVLKLHPAKALPKYQKSRIPVSPLDLLPYIRSWVLKHATPDKIAGLVVAYGPMLGFASHVARQIVEHCSTSQDSQS
ncbi:hypothetical protein ACA910_002638 [Epithemia clementina (nom. ined.)]